MKLKTIVLAAAVALISSLAFAQPAPIGSTTGEDMDFRTNRSSAPRYHRQARFVKHRHPHFAEHRH
jgi:hypothetical protein